MEQTNIEQTNMEQTNMEQTNILQNEIEYNIIKILNLQKHIQLLQQIIKTTEIKISTQLIQQNNVIKKITLIQANISNIQLSITNHHFNIILTQIKNDPDKFGKIYSEISNDKYNDLSTEEKKLKISELLKELCKLQKVDSIDNIIYTEPINLFEAIQKINDSQKEIDLEKEKLEIEQNKIKIIENEINDLQHQNDKKQFSLSLCFEQINQLNTDIQELQHKIENILH